MFIQSFNIHFNKNFAAGCYICRRCITIGLSVIVVSTEKTTQLFSKIYIIVCVHIPIGAGKLLLFPVVKIT